MVLGGYLAQPNGALDKDIPIPDRLENDSIRHCVVPSGQFRRAARKGAGLCPGDRLR
jgi:hypothetical protein